MMKGITCEHVQVQCISCSKQCTLIKVSVDNRISLVSHSVSKGIVSRPCGVARHAFDRLM